MVVILQDAIYSIDGEREREREGEGTCNETHTHTDIEKNAEGLGVVGKGVTVHEIALWHV